MKIASASSKSCKKSAKFHSSFLFFSVVKYTQHKVYHLLRGLKKVCGNSPLCFNFNSHEFFVKPSQTFNGKKWQESFAWSYRLHHHASPVLFFYLPRWKVYLLNNNSSSPAPHKPLTTTPLLLVSTHSVIPYLPFSVELFSLNTWISFSNHFSPIRLSFLKYDLFGDLTPVCLDFI